MSRLPAKSRPSNVRAQTFVPLSGAYAFRARPHNNEYMVAVDSNMKRARQEVNPSQDSVSAFTLGHSAPEITADQVKTTASRRGLTVMGDHVNDFQRTPAY
ncbi:hypothetical protein LTR29_000903 [Friedmanniomyces endolithicus]|nr:hypothetical protein LTR29_000903 [Friedmanniomyces endolithicus]